MDTLAADAFRDSYAAPPPVLIAGDSDAALDRAARTIEASGLRIGAVLPLAQAAERIRLQPSATALWLELERDGGEAMDELVCEICEGSDEGRFAAIIAAPRDLVDPLFSRIASSRVELIVDGSEADRAAALAIATLGLAGADRLSDIATDQNSARLRQLSERSAGSPRR